MDATRHPGSILTALGVVILIAGLAAEANVLIVGGLVIALLGAAAGVVRR